MKNKELNQKKRQALKVCRTATVAYYIKNHLKSQVEYMRDQGVQISVVCTYDKDIHDLDLDENLTFTQIKIERQIAPIKDLISLLKLIYHFNKYKFDIVHSTTPKAGLLTAIAGFICRIPVRLHTWTGQPWVTMTGLKKKITMSCDQIIGRLNTMCYADSSSQQQFLIRNRIVAKNKIKVLNKGSISGINLDRFKPAQISKAQRKEKKEAIGVTENSKIITFIGRINKDKGIFELISAFKEIYNQGYDSDLLLIGPLDQDSNGDPEISLENYIEDCPRIHYVGYQKKPEIFLAVSDIFCLPSYREGFGTTVIEAAALGVPSIGTNIVGLIDAIEDGITGILVKVKSTDALTSGLKQLLDDPEKAIKMGKNAQKRCVENFSQNLINQLMWQEYKEFIEQ